MATTILNTIGNRIESIVADHLFQSDFYQVKSWSFDFMGNRQLRDGYNDCFCLVIVKKGKFLFDLGRQSHDMHTGHIVIEKPNYEYRLRPASGECSIINFTNEFYQQFINDLHLQQSFFFSSNNILSLLLKTSPEIEYLHYKIIKGVRETAKLKMDNLVLELLKLVTTSITNTSFTDELDQSLKANHLITMEKAKEYINDNFEKDISLEEISRYSCVSLFHFSRIFKKFTSLSPYQYLLNVRLKHSEMLLKSGTMPVADIAILSGFNSAENFATAFKQKYKMSPSQYRK